MPAAKLQVAVNPAASTSPTPT